MKKKEEVSTPKTVQQILDRLRKGNEYFVNNRNNDKTLSKAEQEAQVKGQNPYAIILGCADSRVAPELVFNTSMGELFTIRVAGNVASLGALASIEYAIAHLKTKVIVVLGHQSCGAVGAAIGGGNNGYNINQLLSYVTPAIASVKPIEPKADYIAAVVKQNAILTISDLTAQSTIIRDAVKSGAVMIFPAYYHLTNGKVDFLSLNEV